MKKRSKLTPFAKIVILAVVVLIARYAYIHREEIASGDFFKLSDTVEVVLDTNELISNITDTGSIEIDTIKKDIIVQDILISDTVTIIIEKHDDILSIITSNKSVNILLGDSIQVSDTILFNIPKGGQSIGRIIIK